MVARLATIGHNLVRPEHLQLLGEYCTMLHAASAQLNLVAEGDRDELAIRHIMPSLAMGGAVASMPNRHILDFGSGAGIPGVPLKILFPGSDFVLVESRRRRANFLRDVIRRLQLKRIEVRNCRIEALYDELAEAMDIVVSRAAIGLDGLWRSVGPVLKAHGVAVATLNEGRGFAVGESIIARKSTDLLGRTTCFAILR